MAESTGDTSNAEILRRLDGIDLALREMTSTYVRKDVADEKQRNMDLQFASIVRDIADLENAARDAAAEQATNRRFRIGAGVTLIAASIGGIIALIASLH